MLQLIVAVSFIILAILIIFSFFSQVYQSLFQADKFVPFVPSKGDVALKIVEFGDIKDGHKVIELGSGTGTLLYGIAKLKKVEILGIESSLYLTLVARLLKILTKTDSTIVLKHGDLLEEDFSKYDRIVFFLTPNIVKNYLHEKFLKETKKDVVIISHGFKMETKDFTEERYESGHGSFQRFVYVYRKS